MWFLGDESTANNTGSRLCIKIPHNPENVVKGKGVFRNQSNFVWAWSNSRNTQTISQGVAHAEGHDDAQEAQQSCEQSNSGSEITSQRGATLKPCLSRMLMMVVMLLIVMTMVS